VYDDEALWTARDASRLLGPPYLSVREVRELIRLTSIQPAGKRRTTSHGFSGRYARVYQAADLIRAYDAIDRVTDIPE
jgi:hypothetical protein